jgi:hypothetical protein
MKQTIFIIVLLTLLASCDCHQHVKGTVLDNATKEPIKDVEIFNKKKSWDNVRTNEKGFFELSSISGGLTCPPMTIIIEHQDYEKLEIEIEAGGYKDILLAKKQIKQIDTLTYK